MARQASLSSVTKPFGFQWARQARTGQAKTMQGWSEPPHEPPHWQRQLGKTALASCVSSKLRCERPWRKVGQRSHVSAGARGLTLRVELVREIFGAGVSVCVDGALCPEDRRHRWHGVRIGQQWPSTPKCGLVSARLAPSACALSRATPLW